MNDSQLAEDVIKLAVEYKMKIAELEKTLLDVITTMQGQLLAKDIQISKLEKEIAELKGDYKFEHN